MAGVEVEELESEENSPMAVEVVSWEDGAVEAG